MTVLELHEVSVTYPGPVPAVRGMTLTVSHGECVALIGESGSGKTSVARAILGLVPEGTLITGSIVVAGIEVVGLPSRQHHQLRGTHIGYVPQDPHAGCDPLRQVRHHIAEAWTAKRQRVPVGVIDEMLSRVGIAEPGRRSRQRPHQWSGGMLQRASIAAATAHHPPITIADEPTSALDPERAHDIIDVLRSSCDGLLLIAHDLALVANHADHVVVCLTGRIIESGPAAVVLRRPAHPYTRRLLAAAPRSRLDRGGQ